LRKTATDPVGSWLARGLDLLARNEGREAADLFGRVLLRDPGNAEARRGLERARASVRETERALEAQLEQAGRAWEAGDEARARAYPSSSLSPLNWANVRAPYQVATSG
jgi:hypothetical protein